jgi:hypothetical protein
MARAPIKIEAMTTEDGDPWGVFAYGHDIPIKDFTLANINAALDEFDIEPLDEMPKVNRLWMRQEPEGDSDFPWFWCEEADAGAIAVTGVSFE